MTDKIDNLAPWQNQYASDWLASQSAWSNFLAMIRRTIEHDPRDYPHQIRCAISLVILLCREGLWRENLEDRDELVSLSRRQLSHIKQLYSSEARAKPEVATSKEYRDLMRTLDEEMRVLDARMSEHSLNIPKQAPAGWGDFFQTEN